jgi:hypothetical protein
VDSYHGEADIEEGREGLLLDKKADTTIINISTFDNKGHRDNRQSSLLPVYRKFSRYGMTKIGELYKRRFALRLTRNHSVKWVFLFLLPSIIILFSHSLVHSEWESVVAPPAVGYSWGLHGVHFTSATEGWAVGSDDNERTEVLLHYQNGNWTDVPPPTVGDSWGLSSVHFTSATEGWAVGADHANTRGVLLHYQNGDWTSVAPPAVSVNWTLWGVHFISSNEGWAVGGDNLNDRPVLLRYHNGAWASVPPPLLSYWWSLYAVHFTSANEGWAVGDSESNGGVGVLLHYFTSSPNNTLTVIKTGQGIGIVSSNPPGISCGNYCSMDYPYGTVVTLTASAEPGSEFRGWSGSGCSGTGECVVTVNKNAEVTATFAVPSELSTTEGTIGTQLTITGSDFGTKKGKVLIGGVATKISKDGWNNTIITCAVTKVLPAGGPYHVTIRPYKADDITLPNAFTIKPPEIDSLDVYHGVAGVSSITITGTFFSTKKGKVYLGGVSTGKKNCKVKSWGMDSITFVVPKGLISGVAYPLKVTNKVGIAEAPSDFTID